MTFSFGDIFTSVLQYLTRTGVLIIRLYVPC